MAIFQAAIGYWQGNLRGQVRLDSAQAINAVTADSISKFTEYVGEVVQMGPQMQQSPAGDKFDRTRRLRRWARR